MSDVIKIIGGKGMTKMVMRTNLKEVNSVKVRCGKCGTVIENPIKKYNQDEPNLNISCRCDHCDERIPEELVDAIKHMNSALVKINKDTSGFSIEIETEETE